MTGHAQHAEVPVHVVPLHARLRDELVSAILTGEYAQGDRIPSERVLCERFRVSRTTARRTLSELVHDGWLYTVSGKGTYVSGRHLDQELQPFTGFADDLARRGIEVGARVLLARDAKATDEQAAQLGVLPRTPVVELHRVRLAGGLPVAIQRTSLPEHRCPGILRFDFSRRSLYEVLRTEYGLRLHRGHSVIRAGLATPTEARHLGEDGPVPVLRTFQTTFLEDGGTIEYCESVFHGDRYALTFDAMSGEGHLPTAELPGPVTGSAHDPPAPPDP